MCNTCFYVLRGRQTQGPPTLATPLHISLTGMLMVKS